MNTGGHLAVRAPGDPGALALSTAVVEAALESARWSAVTVLAERSVAELFAGLPWAERVRAVDGDGEGTAWRAVAPQAALLLDGRVRTAWHALRARIPLRAGLAGGLRGALLTHAVSPPRCAARRLPVPPAHLQRDLAGLLDLAVGARPPRLRPSPGDGLRAAEALAVAGLEPGAPYFVAWADARPEGSRAPHPSTVEALVELADRLGPGGVVLEGARTLGQPPPGPAAYVPVGADLALASALVAGARLALCEGDGARWIAASHGVGCLRLLAPDAPPAPAGFPERSRVVRRDEGRAHRAAVVEAAEGLLADREEGG